MNGSAIYKEFYIKLHDGFNADTIATLSEDQITLFRNPEEITSTLSVAEDEVFYVN